MNSYFNELASLLICCIRNLNGTVILTIEYWTKLVSLTYTHPLGMRFSALETFLIPGSADPAALESPCHGAGLSLVALLSVPNCTGRQTQPGDSANIIEREIYVMVKHLSWCSHPIANAGYSLYSQILLLCMYVSLQMLC